VFKLSASPGENTVDSAQARIIVSVSGHWLVGTLPSHGERIQDILRDKNQEFIKLDDVQICRPAQGEWCQAALSQTIVPRHEIEFVILPCNRHEAPIKRYMNFTVRETVGCLLTVRQYCIQGEVHVPAVHDDAAYTFINQLGSFFPVTNICLNATGIDRLTAPVMFVNKQYVSCFYLGALLVAEESPTEVHSKSATQGLETGIDTLLALIESYKNDSVEEPLRDAKSRAEIIASRRAGE
jgi:hypothetical protein